MMELGYLTILQPFGVRRVGHTSPSFKNVKIEASGLAVLYKLTSCRFCFCSLRRRLYYFLSAILLFLQDFASWFFFLLSAGSSLIPRHNRGCDERYRREHLVVDPTA